jgi:hypothetical protein
LCICFLFVMEKANLNVVFIVSIIVELSSLHKEEIFFCICMCVVYFSLPSLMGTLPSGVHLLPWVHPKRRKSKAKKIDFLYWKKNSVIIRLLRTFLCRLHMKISCYVLPNCLLNRNTVLLSLSLLYLGKYRLKKRNRIFILSLIMHIKLSVTHK